MPTFTEELIGQIQRPGQKPENVKLIVQKPVPLIQTFEASDATPSVLGGKLFKTANATVTSYTDFDDGHVGQVIDILIDDAKSEFDFTGTNLKSYSGTDWDPADGSSMRCVYDGSSWFCMPWFTWDDGNGIGPVTLAGAVGQVSTFGPGISSGNPRGDFGYVIDDGDAFFSMLSTGVIYKLLDQKLGHTYIEATQNASSSRIALFFASSQKLITKTDGITVTGNVAATSFGSGSILSANLLSKIAGETITAGWTIDGGLLMGDGFLQLPRTTTAALEAVANDVNTNANKIAGTTYFNTDTGKVVVAAGDADADVWTDTVANTLHTPVV